MRIDEIELLEAAIRRFMSTSTARWGRAFRLADFGRRQPVGLLEVTVDPNALSTPFIIEDELRFNTNGNEQHVDLIAWGQNAHFHGGLGELNRCLRAMKCDK